MLFSMLQMSSLGRGCEDRGEGVCFPILFESMSCCYLCYMVLSTPHLVSELCG